MLIIIASQVLAIMVLDLETDLSDWAMSSVCICVP